MTMMINKEQENNLIDSMMHPKTHPYHKMFLDDMEKTHKDLFERFIKEISNKDFFSLVDAYLITSEIRKFIDKGTRYGLERTSKSCIESINMDLCFNNESKNEIDVNTAKWMGTVYNYMQWKYNITSQEICEHIPAKELYNLYETYKEQTLNEVVNTLHHDYFILNKEAKFKPYIKKNLLENEKEGDFNEQDR